MCYGSPLFRLLGDDARLRMLRLLAAERLNVSELTGILGLAQSGVSRHLGMLKDAGLITEQREGVYTWYRLSPPPAGSRQRLRSALAAAPGAIRADRRARPTAARTTRGSRKCGGCARRTSTSTAARMRASVSSCRDAAGRRGRARSGICCRRGASPTSGAATAT